jgi:tellurite resistance protein TerC
MPKRFSVWVRKIAIAVAGASVLVCGLALVVVPIPGTSFVVIPLGLAILSKEFVWARRMLGWSRRFARSLWSAVRRRTPWDSLTPAPART